MYGNPTMLFCLFILVSPQRNNILFLFDVLSNFFLQQSTSIFELLERISSIIRKDKDDEGHVYTCESLTIVISSKPSVPCE